jgi:glycerol-3-phosphate dehydrogenase subunit C
MSHEEPKVFNLFEQSVEFTLDSCIKCNICVTECPVVAVADVFPGPKYEAPQAGRFRQAGAATADQSVDYCLGCRVCNMVCPSGVKIAEMNARARAAMVEQGKVPARLRLRNNMLGRAELLGKLGQPVAPLANALLKNGLVRQVADVAMGIAPDAPLPAFSSKRFTRWFKKRARPEAALNGKVVYFHGCSTEYYEPWVGKAAVQVLEASGLEVLVPRQNCCGLPLLSNGEFGAARRYHESNVRHLLPYAQQGYAIVGTSTSCILTLKEEAPELLDMHDAETQLVAAHTYDINEYLLMLHEAGQLNTDLRPLPMRLAYHAPCQYRAHRLGYPALEVMRLIPKLEIVLSHAACCGVGGTYGYKSEKREISLAVGQPLFEFVKEVGGPVAVCDSETCRWQITGVTEQPTVHPVELLAAAYGFPVEGPLADLLPPEYTAPRA